jgi:hypothetical protein
MAGPSATTITTKPLVFSNNTGGLSDDPKVGIKYSFADGQGINFRSSPSQLTVLPGLSREDNGIVQDLILNEVMTSDGTIYAVGDAGWVYSRDTSGVWTVFGNLTSGTAGIDYRADTDSIYLTSQKTGSVITGVVNGPSQPILVDYYNDSFTTYDNSVNAGFNVNCDQEGSDLTTAILEATSPLNEADTSRRYFQTDIEPLDKIEIFVVQPGSGDWTLTLHDGLNKVLGTATVTNGDLTANSWTPFEFTTAPNGQVRVYIAPNARTYHYHITSTTTDGTVSSSATNDLSTSDCRIYADRFVYANNGLHPIQRYLEYECFGNGNYLSAWQPISDPPTNNEWLRHRLTFPQEYEVCGLALQNEFLVIACEKNTTLNTSTPQEGMLFFWDGSSDTYVYNVPIQEGTPFALNVYKNVIYYFAGGTWWALSSPTTVPVPQKQMPGTNTDYSGAYAPITMYPYSATIRRDIQLFTWPGTVPNSDMNFGVYSWGQKNKNYAESLGYDYTISTGSQNYSATNNLKLGMAQAFGDLLHVSWRDDLNGGYGIDAVTNSSTPAPYSYWQSLVFDAGFPGRIKTAYYMEVYYQTLPADTTITMSYSINHGAWQYSPAYSLTNQWQGRNHYARLQCTADAGGGFHDIQLQLEINCDGATTSPAVEEIALIYDTNANNLLQ